eukprot:UN20956
MFSTARSHPSKTSSGFLLSPQLQLFFSFLDILWLHLSNTNNRQRSRQRQSK